MSKLEQVWSHWFWEIGSGDGIRCQGALKGQDGQNIALEGWQALSSVCDLYVELTGAVRSATIHPMRCSRGSDRLASRDTRPLQFLLVKHTLSSAIESPIATVYWSLMRLSQLRATTIPFVFQTSFHPRQSDLEMKILTDSEYLQYMKPSGTRWKAASFQPPCSGF